MVYSSVYLLFFVRISFMNLAYVSIYFKAYANGMLIYNRLKISRNLAYLSSFSFLVREYGYMRCCTKGLVIFPFSFLLLWFFDVRSSFTFLSTSYFSFSLFLTNVSSLLLSYTHFPLSSLPPSCFSLDSMTILSFSKFSTTDVSITLPLRVITALQCSFGLVWMCAINVPPYCSANCFFHLPYLHFEIIDRCICIFLIFNR